MEVALNKIVPASWTRDGTFLHTMEGDDDMPGHVKSSMMGVSLNIPIRNGHLALGTWQGIYLVSYVHVYQFSFCYWTIRTPYTYPS